MWFIGYINNSKDSIERPLHTPGLKVLLEWGTRSPCPQQRPADDHMLGISNAARKDAEGFPTKPQMLEESGLLNLTQILSLYIT